MNKAKVLVLGGLREEALDDLKQNCEVTMGPVGHRMDDDYEWVVDHIAGYDGLIAPKMTIDKKILDNAKNLKIISTYGVGFDHIDVDYAKQKGIVVSNCPKSVTRPTAELALAMILACARRLHFYDHSLREGAFLDVNEYDNQGFSIEGKTLGILGMGRIGQLVAQFGQMLGMNIIYHNRHQVATEIEDKVNAKYVDFDTLIKESDFLTIHLPATDETEHIIDSDVLKKMKSTAFLINVARGSLVDQMALVKALKTAEIAGAGLDVLENEPHIDEELAALDNVIMTPHVGSATHVARQNLTKEASENIISFFVNGKALNQVD
ncbi:2-hydroxyacid dehydrogenase family protein [Lactobacillus hamsteri]|uniref:D-isomer specific 2-hydroxyacid dehydrogenase, NAD-binding protein n=1 Tax=Lactobacillus hamsteri DSM 5661 = JCM 6256 TaxID=1423754 RepID=A0A0R1YBP2_9LACO|nr:NAD(P)-dependent oxidoreductase [Lactobacillus hamsteri]KRM39806.1 D-isomer specific 2-hydroxyacid dehydrogenase, NAD-binding protein [Lactobacillus hamsteri DSM 5661 = JCM 6256]